MGEDDRKKYRIAQQAQQKPSGAYMSFAAHNQGHVYEMSDEGNQKSGWSDSAESLGPGEDIGRQDPYFLARSRAANSHSANLPASRSPVTAPRRPSGAPSIELGRMGHSDLGLPQPSFDSGEGPHSYQPRRIRGERSPLGREPMTRQPTFKGDHGSMETEQLAQQQDPLMSHQPQQPDHLNGRPSRQHSPPPASYRPPRQEDPLMGEASSARSSRSGSMSETDSTGKRRRARLQKPKPNK